MSAPLTDASWPARTPELDVRAVLAALSEPHRADIVRLLEVRRRSQKGLQDELGLAQPLLSHHLSVLEDAGLTRWTRCGRYRVYELRADTLHGLAQRLLAMAAAAVRVADEPPC